MVCVCVVCPCDTWVYTWCMYVCGMCTRDIYGIYVWYVCFWLCDVCVRHMEGVYGMYGVSV